MKKLIEIDFLNGPLSRLKELSSVFSISKEFIKGFRTLHFVGPCVAVFGSARFKEDHPYYAIARKYGGLIAQHKLTALTGGGPGIMEAANRGAFENGGKSVGINIVLPHEQKANKYIQVGLEMEHFYVRKTMLIKYSLAFIVMPGGMGTLDELFETITLIQTQKIKKIPIVLHGVEYWQSLMVFIDKMAVEGTIAPEDKNLIFLTDDVHEGMQFLLQNISSNDIRKQEELAKKSSWFFAENQSK
jgi:uncharacterized protein (TIGR00730 family)